MSDAPAVISRRPTGPDQTAPGLTGPGNAAAPGAGGQAAAAPAAASATSNLLAELKVSGHVMTLDPGLYCIIHKPSQVGDSGTGLPGIRVSMPPQRAGRVDHVSIASFREDGWLSTSGDAALVRVSGSAAQVLVTIYQALGASDRTAPNIQVTKLFDGQAAAPRPPQEPAPVAAPPEPVRPQAPRNAAVMEMVAHIQERGDVGAMLGAWLGEPGSRRWIEGFGLSPTSTISSKDIEYQAVLGQGWLSPWVEGGQFCGSRGMALPLLGLRVRLRGAVSDTHDVSYSASFVDGTSIGPVTNGEACEADSLAALEAFQIVVSKRARQAAPAEQADPVAARSGRSGKQGRRPGVDETPPALATPPKSKSGNRKR